MSIFDHVGSMARLQQASGAPVLVGAGAVDVIRTEKERPRDPQAGLHDPMEPRDRRDPRRCRRRTGGHRRRADHRHRHTGAHHRCDELAVGKLQDGACITIVYADSPEPGERR